MPAAFVAYDDDDDDKPADTFPVPENGLFDDDDDDAVDDIDIPPWCALIGDADVAGLAVADALEDADADDAGDVDGVTVLSCS